MEVSDRKRRLEEIKNSNQHIRRLANQGNLDQIAQYASQIKRNLENESTSDTNSVRMNAQTSAFHIVEHAPIEEQSKRRNILDRSPQPTEEIKLSKKRKQSFHGLSMQAKSAEQELMELKQHKLNSELEIKELHKQIEQLRAELESLKAQPIFKCEEKLALFCTKIFVRQEDYDKIDYLKLQVQLDATSITIQREEAVWRKLQLERIKEVRYLDRKMMVEFLTESDESEYLFLSFVDSEHLKKWDFGMYLNRFILASRRKEKLFWSQYSLPLATNGSPIRAFKQQRQLSTSVMSGSPVRKPSADISKKLDGYRQPILEEDDPYQSSKDPPNHRGRPMSNEPSQGSVGHKSKGKQQNPEPQPNRKPPPLDIKSTLSRKQDGPARPVVNFLNSSFNPNYSQNGAITEERSESPQNGLEKNYQKEKERVDEIEKDIQQKRRRIRQRKDQERIEFKAPSDDEEQKPNSRAADFPNTSNTSNFRLEPPPTSRTEPVQMNASKLNLFPVQLPAINVHPIDPNNSTISIDQSEQTKKQTIDSLRKPKQFMKYAKGGLKPRLKQVYLSQNEQELCWKDIQTKKVNKIKVDSIQQIIVGQLGEGMKRFDSKLNRDECLIIKTQDRVIELHSNDKQLVKKFSNELQFFRNLQHSVVGN